MDYIKLTESLVSKAKQFGAGSAEVYLETGRNLSIQVQDGEIETIEEASSAGVGFRVIVDGKMGFSHCNDLSNNALEDTLKRAIEFAKLTTPDENNVLPDDKGISVVNGLYDPEINTIPMERKIQMTIDLEKLAMKDARITKSSGASYGEGEGEVFIANTNGLSKSYKVSGCNIGVSVVAEKEEQKNTGGEYSSRRFFSDLPALEVIAEKASKKAWELLDPVTVSTQKAAVICSPEVAGSFFGGVLEALNGERVTQGASFLKDYLDKPFASPLLTIIDDGTRDKGMGSAPFDGEGVPTQKRVLVDKGVVKGFIYNTMVAKRAATKSTGNASRGGFTRLPGIGAHNLTIEPGTSTLAEIILNTDNGLLLKEVTGYGIDPVTGNFSGGATGFWIEKGQIKHPVQGVTIAGNAFDMLNNIDMMGNDIDLNRGLASPTFRIKVMQIGGNNR
jgi:PmbA protein